VEVIMRENVGSIDRAIRVALGLLLLLLVKFGPATPWGYLGFVPLLTGAFGWCPLYALFRISTVPRSPQTTTG
jgi:hypothetical protein